MEEINTGDADTGNTDAGSDSNTEPTFIETLPEGFRESEAFQGVEDIGQLATKYAELKEAADSMPKPPDKAEDYDFGLEENAPVDEARLAWFRDVAHEMGLSNETAAKLVQGELAQTQEAVKAIEQQEQTAIDGLKQEYGDDYEANVKAGAEFVRNHGGEELANFLDQTRLGNNPEFVRFVVKLSKAVSGDSLVQGEAGGNKLEVPRSPGGQPMLKFPSMQT